MKLSSKYSETVAAVRADIAPDTPCAHADAEGYCTGPCEGALCCKCADYKPATAVAVADQTATLPAVPIHLENMPALTPTESVRFDLGMAKKCGALTLAYLTRAGWKLACEKEGAGHGGWLELCKNVGISPDTATRYIKFYYSTVGEHLRAQGTAHRLVENLTDSMIEEALSGLESKIGRAHV